MMHSYPWDVFRTPTIQLVNTRQQEINQFKPQQYYTFIINGKGFDFQLESNQRYTNKETLEQIVNNLKMSMVG